MRILRRGAGVRLARGAGRRHGILLACFAAGSFCSAPRSSSAGDLAELVGAALGRSPQVQEARAALPARAAESSGARRWLKSEPRLSAQAISDRWDADLGAGEQEFELSAEMWIPGERTAAIATTEASAALAGAELALAELAVASDVRDAYWDLVAAERLLEVEREAVVQSTSMREAVRRLVDAREAPPNDLRLAEATLAEAQVEFQRSSVAVADASARLLRLTGVGRASGAAEPAGGPVEGPHPEEQAALARTSMYDAAADLARRQPGAAPELGVVMRRERFLQGAPYDESVGLRVTLPLWTGPTASARRIDASARSVGAETALQRTREELEGRQAAARRALELAERTQALAKHRASELAAYVAAVDRAFGAGEISLLELQRARRESTGARRSLVEAEVAVNRGRSMLNQAEGRLP